MRITRSSRFATYSYIGEVSSELIKNSAFTLLLSNDQCHFLSRAEECMGLREVEVRLELLPVASQPKWETIDGKGHMSSYR